MFIGRMKLKDKSASISLLLLFCFWPAPSRGQGQATFGTHGADFNLAVTATDGSYSIGGAGIEGPVLEANVAAKVDGRWLRPADYPKHQVVESQIADELGPARELTVTHAGLSGEPDLVCFLKIRPGTLWADVEVQVVNHENKSFTIQAIRPIEAFGDNIINLGGPESSDRVLSDSFSEDRPGMRIHDLLETPPVEMHRAVGVQLIYNRTSGRSLFIGALDASRLLTILRVHLDPKEGESKIRAYEVDSTGTTEMLKENSLQDSPPEDQIELSLQLTPGQSLASERLLISVSSDYHAQLDTYGSIIGRLHHPRSSAVTPMGWWSWTAYYFGLNQGTAWTNAEWLAQHLQPFGYDYFHIDEGYQFARGEYTAPDAGLFPDGMHALEQKIRSLGLIPGLWTAPFEVSERSWVYLNHKDWLVHNAKGDPIRLGTVTENVDRLYALDTTNPGAQAYLRDTYRTLVKEWGIRYIKLDFMEDSDPEGVRYKPNTAALEAQRIGLSVIREAVGENVLLDKDGSPMLTPVGIVDTGRISQDTGHSFDATKDAAPGIAARYYMNRNFFISDPDAFGVSRQSVTDQSWHGGQRPVTLDEAKASISLAAVAGGMYEIGDDLPTLALDADRVALVENRDLIGMIRLGRAACPVDLMSYLREDEQPSIFLLGEDRRQSILTVFNWTNRRRQHHFSFAQLGLNGKGPFQVLDVFESGKSIATVNGSFVVQQPAHSARVLKIVDTSIALAAPSVAIQVVKSGRAGDAIQMYARTDPNGVPALSYEWDFGDGTTELGPFVVHAYTQARDYEVRLVAQGLDGISAKKSSHISVTDMINTRYLPDKKHRIE
jgi:alpha-galactosidase